MVALTAWFVNNQRGKQLLDCLSDISTQASILSPEYFWLRGRIWGGKQICRPQPPAIGNVFVLIN
jgi:hypothetical protein